MDLGKNSKKIIFFKASNINDKIKSGEQTNGFAVTTAKGLHPCQRSVFIIER